MTPSPNYVQDIKNGNSYDPIMLPKDRIHSCELDDRHEHMSDRLFNLKKAEIINNWTSKMLQKNIRKAWPLVRTLFTISLFWIKNSTRSVFMMVFKLAGRGEIA